MKKVLSQILLLSMIALTPLALGEAEERRPAEPATEVKAESAEHAGVPTVAAQTAVTQAARKPSNECLASEEIIADIQLRERKLKEREAQLAEREKDLEAQQKIIGEELAKLDAARSEIQGAHAKAMAEHEERVNKLIETFETMSPKAAAGVINGVDEELAVTALSRLSTTKAGKILANLSPQKSSKLSELMAFGNSSAKEKTRGESDRAPAAAGKR